MKKQEMESLSIADLDIAELERRLELAAAAGGPVAGWTCQVDVCGADCSSLCAANVKV